MSVLAEGEPMTVTQIQVAMYRLSKNEIGQAQTSALLAVLRRHGVVKSIKDGKFRMYSLNRKRIAKIDGAILRFADGGLVKHGEKAV